MWLVHDPSSLNNRDKTILKKLTLIQDLQYNCHKDNHNVINLIMFFTLIIIIKLCNVVFLQNSYIIIYDFIIEI